MSLRSCLLLLALLAAPAAAGDPPVTVLKVPGDSDTIQGAVDMAGPGTVILVKKAIYDEDVLIARKTGLTLIGKGKPGIDSPSAAPAILVQDSTDIVIQGFRIAFAVQGIEIDGSSHVTVRKCLITDIEENGVHAFDSSFLVIEKNRVLGAGQFGLDIGDVPGVTDCLVQKNRVEDTGSHGILLGGDRNAAEKNRVARAGGHGLEIRSLVASSDCTVSKNVAKDVGAVGLLCNGTGSRFEKNKVVGSAEAGMLIDETSTDNTFTGNKLAKVGEHGISVEGDGNTITGCKVKAAPAHGIFVGGDGNTFEGNSASKSASDGFHVAGTGNSFTENKAKGSGDLDLEDENAPGANTYTDNVFPESNLDL